MNKFPELYIVIYIYLSIIDKCLNYLIIIKNCMISTKIVNILLNTRKLINVFKLVYNLPITVLRYNF